jgi:hypothetical protein
MAILKPCGLVDHCTRTGRWGSDSSNSGRGYSVSKGGVFCAPNQPDLVAVVVGLVGAFDRHADVIGLFLAQRGQTHTQVL